MIYNYYEAIEKYKNSYNLSKAIEKKEIYKIEKGLYSDDTKYRSLDVFIKKYNNPIFTMQSAFYYYGISDVIPDKYYIASSKSGSKYNISSIKQYYMDDSILNIGETSIEYLGTKISIYSKERLLIEIIRYKNMIDYDYYKEIINYYRKQIDDIDFQYILDILTYFPKKEMIHKIIQEEVL
ncbi:MAG: hypothetical protein J5691_04085 [Bacilli bacterium]|nr:hypothetical protein [Bacilli bacterium]